MFQKMYKVLYKVIKITARSPRILGAQNAPEGKYPYQVSIQYFGSHICGGSIIFKQWILTAAQCIEKYII